MKFYMKCLVCEKEYPEDSGIFQCNCGGKVDTIINLDNIDISKTDLKNSKETDPLFRYFDFYPLFYRDKAISGGSIITPYFYSSQLSKELSLKVFIKNETLNPTASFKIKPISVGFNYGLEHIHTNKKNKQIFTTASCGNAADALASLCAKTGNLCIIFVPAETTRERISSLIHKGAYVVPVLRDKNIPGDPTYYLMRKAVKKLGWIPLPSSGQDNSAQIEGAKSIAFEICEQSGFEPPDHIVIQVGGGGLLNGIIKGFREFEKLELIEESPEIHIVQSEGCAPLIEAYKNMTAYLPQGWDEVLKIIKEHPEIIKEWKDPRSVAWGILDDFPHDFAIGLAGVFQTGGSAVVVSDEEILTAYKLAAKKTGLFPCPTGSTGLVGLIKLRNLGVIDKNEKCAIIFTGSGYKQLETPAELYKTLTPIDPYIKNLYKLLDTLKIDY